MDLTKKEIKEGNALLAVFMGGVFNSFFYQFPYEFGYKETHDEGGFVGAGPEAIWTVDEMIYHESMDWMWPVIDKINGMGKEYSFATFKTYASCTVEKGGRVYKDFAFAHAEYITAEQSSKEAVYRLLVKFIKWHNETIIKIIW